MTNQLTPEDWLGSMPLAAIEAKIETLEGQAQRIGVELTMWRSALALQRGREAEQSLQRRPEAPQLQNRPTQADGGAPTLRQAVLKLIASEPNRRWATRQIRERLVEAGVLLDTVNASTHLYSMLSNMATKGQIKRPETGFYMSA
jgi:hypothetical protein